MPSIEQEISDDKKLKEQADTFLIETRTSYKNF